MATRTLKGKQDALTQQAATMKHPIPGFDRLPPDLQTLLRGTVKHLLQGRREQGRTGTELEQPTRLKVDFGVYEMADAETLGWFARDVTRTVEMLLRYAGGQEHDMEQEELSAIGNLLEWARKCQEYHGIEADKGERERLKEKAA